MRGCWAEKSVLWLQKSEASSGTEKKPKNSKGSHDKKKRKSSPEKQTNTTHLPCLIPSSKNLREPCCPLLSHLLTYRQRHDTPPWPINSSPHSKRDTNQTTRASPRANNFQEPTPSTPGTPKLVLVRVEHHISPEDVFRVAVSEHLPELRLGVEQEGEQDVRGGTRLLRRERPQPLGEGGQRHGGHQVRLGGAPPLPVPR